MLIKKNNKKTSDTSGLVVTPLLNTKISGWVKETDYCTKIGEIGRKISDHDHNKKYTTQFKTFKSGW